MITDNDLHLLAQHRQGLDEANQRLAEMRSALETSPEYEFWRQLADTHRLSAAELTEAIKTEALNDFYINGVKRPHPAVGVRVTTKVKYVESIAKTWAFEHLPQALTLDAGFFERHAKAVAKTDPVPFVELVEAAQITIAGNLSGYIALTPDVAEAAPAGGE